MSSINDKTELEIEKIKSDFIESMELCKYIFEEEAFRKVYQSFERLPPINKAIFDTLSVQFGLLNSQERVKLKSKKDEMKSGLKNLLANDDKFFTSVTSSTGDKNRVLYRHFTVKNLVGNLIQK